VDAPSQNALPEEKQVSSFYHKSASLGVWIVAAQFVAGLFLRPLLQQLPKEGIIWVSYTYGVLNAALFLACTVCGIVALVGIFQHGRHRLLWKGLVCLLPALGFIAAVLLARK